MDINKQTEENTVSGDFSAVPAKELDRGECFTLLFKYGAALFLMVTAILFSPSVIVAFFRSTGIIDGASKNGLYLITLIINDIAVYFFPILFSVIILKKELFCGKLPASVFKKQFRWREILLYYPLMVAFASVVSTWFDYIYGFIKSLIWQMPEIKDPVSSIEATDTTNMLIFLLFICVIAPICEEILFRWILLKPLRKFGDVPAILLTSLFFGLYHGNLSQFFYAFAGGMIFAMVTVKSNSVLPALFIHMSNNILASAYRYSSAFLSNNETPTMLDSILKFLGSTEVIYSTVILLAGIVAAIYMYKKRYFHFTNALPSVSPKAKVLLVIKNPAMIAAVLMFIVFFAMK